MEKQFNYSDQFERVELIQWLIHQTEEKWQNYIDYSFSESQKKEFSYDEKNCLITTKKFLKITEPSTKQFKMMNWAYNIVQRIEERIEYSKTDDGEPLDEKSLNQPARHLTLRVAWHDNFWNGTICDDPAKNIYCNGYHSLLSDRIRREKEKIIPLEIEFHGKSVKEFIEKTGKIPPCFWSINIFGDQPLPIQHINPAAPTQLDPIPENLPPQSMYSWPFAISFVRTNDEFKANGKYPGNLEKVRVPRFRSKIKKEQSIGFIYAKFSNPLSYEEMKYLVIGCGIINGKSDSKYFEPKSAIDKIKSRRRELRNFPQVNWAINFSFDKATLVRLPYHEYMAEAKRRSLDADSSEKLLNKIKVTIDEPELEHCFKYVAMDTDDDEAIFLLTKIRSKLIDAKTDGIIEVTLLDQQISRIENLLEYCWNKRTHFPGLRNLSRILLEKQDNDKCNLDDFVNEVKASEPDYCNKIKELLANPQSDTTYRKYANNLKEIKNTLERLQLNIDRFLLLSMLNLSLKQFDKIKFGLSQNQHTIPLKEVSYNPYLLYEEYKPEEDPQDPITGDYIDYPIELFKIDIALFPNTDYLSSNYIQEQYSISDPRRIRALMLQYLNSLELKTGDCFDTAINIQEYIQSFPLFYKTKVRSYLLPDLFLENASTEFEKHLIQKIEIVEANDTKYYYLKKVYNAEKDVADFINKLLSFAEPNVLSYDNLEIYIDNAVSLLKRKIGGSFAEIGFREERQKLYLNIFVKKFFVLTGNPGSGKSFEILNVIKYLAHKNESYLLLAPTGKAVLRLKFDQDFRDCNIDAMTIDKFLNEWKKRPEKRKEYNNIIIDEMSMVDILKLESVLRCFEPNAPSLHRLILVGDPNQLPPIGFGKPFYDIISFLKSNTKHQDYHIELDVNCRQELEGNDIVAFSKYFTSEGEITPELIDKLERDVRISEGFKIRYWSSENDLLDLLDEEWTQLASDLDCDAALSSKKLDQLFEIKIDNEDYEKIQYDIERFQVISPYRYFSDKVNQYFQSVVRSSSDIEIMKLFKNKDKIIRTMNYYKKNNLILSNGSIGLALDLPKEKILCFPELDNSYLTISGESGIRERDKEFFELAYCITVHKSQRSGFQHTIIILPKKYGLLCKELFYTAFTRSKRSISILIEGESGTSFDETLFAFARKRSYTENRKTSLLLDSPYRYYGLEPEEGVFVQSRVEYIIYHHLMLFRDKYKDSHGFDFRYECYPKVNELKLRIKTDFTIYTKNGIYYWEHLGLLSKSYYKKIWLEIKLPTYSQHNLMDRLITTDELNGISDEKIEGIIQSIFEGNVNNEDKYKNYSEHHFSLR
ncbi:MAG: ATP-dependent RecD-like DNA helicase [Melioribacteraceae bacterium]|nr:ATP-dependent RecD-like DNA helicase [Melioribacteraceae bacterium]